MTRTVNVSEAQNQLPDLLAAALDGNEVIIVQTAANLWRV